jgi:hypothetical protein
MHAGLKNHYLGFINKKMQKKDIELFVKYAATVDLKLIKLPIL